MNSNLQLALRIAGTKERRAGFAPLVTVGVLPGGEGDNMYRSTMVAERPAYVIKHTERYILYQLIDRGVKPFNADANGLLNIALAISSNVQLAEGKSPVTLLDEVYKKFVEIYMEPTSDGRLSFLNTDNDNEIFREIVGKYSLEERKSSYIVMNPTGLTGIVCVPTDDLEDFFKDTQYKEFASYKDIEVGVNCQAQVSLGLDKLQIPLPPAVFEVWVNGKPTDASLQFPDDGYTAAAENTKFYSYESVNFTLGELLTAPSNRISKNGALISLDYQKNHITCDLKKDEILYDFDFDLTDNKNQAKEQILSLIKAGKVKLKFGKEDISATLFEGGQVKATDLKESKVTIEPKVVENFSFSLDCQIDTESHKIATRIIIKPKSISRLGKTDGSKSYPTVTTHIKNNQKDNQLDVPAAGNNTVNTEKQKPQSNKKFDVMSFILGLIVGLLIGLGVWGGVVLLSGDKTASAEDTVTAKNKSNSIEVTDNSVLETDNAISDTDVQDSGQPKEVGQQSGSSSQELPNQVLKEKKGEEALKKKAEEAKIKKEAEKIAQENKKAERAAILALVNQKNLIAIRNTTGLDNILSKKERGAVEAVLDMGKYKGAVLKRVNKLLENKEFNTFEEVIETQKGIWIIQNDKK